MSRKLGSGKLVIATHNAGKLKEISALLAPHGLECLSAGSLGLPEPAETGTTFVENALLKARHAARVTGLAALADDSGLCVDALDGAPGLYSARYAGTHGDAAANIAKLLHSLDGVEDARRGAYFHCTLALLRHPDDPRPLIAEGEWRGRVLHSPRGDGGFGYDPVFLDTGTGLTAAELDPATKNRISHRALAISRLRVALTERVAQRRYSWLGG